MMLQLGPNEPSLITKTQTGIHHGGALPGTGRLWTGVSVCADFDSSLRWLGSRDHQLSESARPVSQHADSI